MENTDVICLLISSQEMVTGLTGNPGPTVPSHVVEASKVDQEVVPIPHRHLEEMIVLETVKKRGRATKTLVQVK